MFSIYKYFYVLAVFNVVKSAYAGAHNSNGYHKSELPCLSYGGLCVKSTDCPEEQRSLVKGLCPSFQEEGYECCHGVGTSETRCRRNGGECISQERMCPPHLVFSRATDCAANQKCCIFVV